MITTSTLVLHPYTHWKEVEYPDFVRRKSIPAPRYRSRSLMLGRIEVACITEHHMRSGICQYTIAWMNRDKTYPSAKYDSFEQAQAYLQELLDGVL